MPRSGWYTFAFAAAVSLVASVFVATSAVVLRDRQEANRVLDQRRKVLDVAGLIEAGESLSAPQVHVRFDETMQAMVIHLATGAPAPEVDADAFDQRKAAQDPATSSAAPENRAGVTRLPEHALVYHVVQDGELQSIILPIEGRGLWSTLYGFIALSADLRTVHGITFYQHTETPGLGGEVDNPRWKASWRGRQAFDEAWTPRLEVVKGRAGPPEEDPFEVDGLSGATLTARGVTHLVRFWLGQDGFGPYLERYRAERGVE
jgi:Na+-transporting NADH:ubiquinone oxidoreductase subunit C